MNHEHDLELGISCDIDSDIEDATYEHYLDLTLIRSVSTAASGEW